MKKKSKKQNNNKIIIGAIVIVVASILLVLLLTNVFKKDTKNKNNDNGSSQNGSIIESDEKTMKEDYSFSKEDAIKVVKKIYNSDNYTFEASANKDNTYTVTVLNTETNESSKYIVDPADGSFSPLDN